MNLIDSIVQLILQVIAQIGYPGIVLLMTLESTGIPIPSEVVMPAGGWLASDGTLNLALVTLAGTAGCVIGSAIAYWIGLVGGRAAVIRYGKYVFLNEGHLDSAERWFNKYGGVTIFVTRLLPIIRTYISFPAGMAKMKFWPFIILSAIGSAIWCFILAYIGYILGPNWESISGSYNTFTIIVLVALGLVLVVGIYLRRRRKATERGKVWSGSPSLWQRCLFCNLRKGCRETNVKRGSPACAQARYTRSKTRGVK